MQIYLMLFSCWQSLNKNLLSKIPKIMRNEYLIEFIRASFDCQFYDTCYKKAREQGKISLQTTTFLDAVFLHTVLQSIPAFYTILFYYLHITIYAKSHEFNNKSYIVFYLNFSNFSLTFYLQILNRILIVLFFWSFFNFKPNIVQIFHIKY